MSGTVESPAGEGCRPAYCDRCGGPVAEADHAACRRKRDLEPPRYCPFCRRRMVVQVLPTGWTARCSVHGHIGDEDAAGQDCG